MKIVVTGASGFIGHALCARLDRQGEACVGLMRKPGSGGAQAWALGDPLPDACRDADAVVHLASATLSEGAADRSSARETDIAGTRLILRQTREWRRDGTFRRFVFISSQSARSDATNDYGRSKWAIEQLLDQEDEVIVRPGLVYSDIPKSVFLTFNRLASLPIAPAIMTAPSIQPVHVDELAESIARAIRIDQPARIYEVGAVHPLTFGQAIAQTAQRAGRRRPLLLPLPLGAVRLTTRLLDGALGSLLTERLNGLASLRPMDTAPSLAALGQVLRDFRAGPASGRSAA